jgi:hypothetical protein
MKTNILVTRTMEVVPWNRPTQNRPLTWDDFMVHSVNRPLLYHKHDAWGQGTVPQKMRRFGCPAAPRWVPQPI